MKTYIATPLRGHELVAQRPPLVLTNEQDELLHTLLGLLDRLPGSYTVYELADAAADELNRRNA